MKKIAAFILAFVCLLSSAIIPAAAHKGLSRDSFEVPETFDTSKKIELSFWAKNDTNVKQAKIYEAAAEKFHELYPNVTVNIRTFTDYGTIYQDVLTSLSTDTTPNICITYPDHIATYMTGENVVVPLDSLFKNKKYGFGGSEVKFDGPKADEMVESFLDECVLSGEHYAVPFVRSTEALYINKTFVEKLGYKIPDMVTWDWIWEVSEKAVEKNADGTFKINGQSKMIPFIYKSTDNMMIQMCIQKGGGDAGKYYSDKHGKIYLYNNTTRELLYEIGKHAETRAFSTFKVSSYPANWLNQGQCIFAIDSTAGSTWMGTNAPLSDLHSEHAFEFETVVKVIPQFDTANPKMISQGPSICIFNKQDPQVVLASWLFTQYLLSNDVQIPYAKTEGYVPVTLKAQNSEAYKEYLSLSGTDNDEHYNVKIDASKLLIENTDNTFITPVFNGSTSLRDAAGALIEDVVKSKRRGETVDDAYMENLFEVSISHNHLNLEGTGDGKQTFGKLPTTSIWLIVLILFAWVLMGAYILWDFLSKRHRKQNNA